MKRKDYQTPTMQVVQLRQRQHILAGSVSEGVSYSRSGYGDANSDVDEEEKTDGAWVW